MGVLASLAWLMLGSAGPAAAVNRYTRVLTHDDGLTVPTISTFAQDDRGYLWIGNEAGLTRYDGRTFERWATNDIKELVNFIATGPGHRVFVSIRAKGVWEVQGRVVVPVTGPDGHQLSHAHTVAVGADGALWVASGDYEDGSVRRRAADGSWGARVRLPDDRAFGLAIDAGGDAFVGGVRALWRVTAGGQLEHLADVPALVPDVIALSEGGCAFTASLSGKAFVYQDGQLRQIAEHTDRVGSIVQRHQRLWISWDKHMGYVDRYLDPGRPAEIFHVQDGGGFLVDHEQSLWMRTFRGLQLFPEPDTVTWGGENDGMTSSHTRSLVRGVEGVWFNAWAAPPYLLDEASGTVRVLDQDPQTFAGPRLCADGQGTVWGGGREGLVARHDRAWEHVPLAGVSHALRCSTADDGRVWMATDNGLFLVGMGQPSLRAAVPEHGVYTVYEEEGGTLWIAAGEHICRGSAPAARAGDDPEWSCERREGIVHPTDFAQTERGTLWLGTRQGGLLMHTAAEGWREVPSAKELVGRSIAALSPSPRGGIWLATPAEVLRVREGATPSSPWAVEEELGPWNGLMRVGAAMVLEDADGTVWLTTSAGLTRVPAGARDQPQPAPATALVGAALDGRSLALDESDGPVHLPYGDHRLELSFTAPSYREPGELRYRLRLGPDEGRSAVVTREPVFNFVGLAPGDYRVEVAASLDGETWSASPAHFWFEVARPWWLQWWTWLGAGLLVLTGFYVAHRARLTIALRLERQRLQIAGDLHDELGSGLGSIGLLAGVASETGTLDGVAAKIADTATELGDSLSDIVSALRPGSGSPRDLAAELTRKGETLFPGDAPVFATRFPTRWPRGELSLGVRRNLQLIAAEALHNAARHGRASRVELGITCGKHWTLWVEDDGVGIPSERPLEPRGGFGLESMRMRAEQIGAELEVGTASGRSAEPSPGTRVTVRFDPRAGDRRIA